MAEHNLSKLKACAAVQLSRSSWYRPAPSTEQRDREVMDALNALVEKHPRWGFWMCYDRLRPNGHRWNHKRVWRVYFEMKLNLPRRKKKRLPDRERQLREAEEAPVRSRSARDLVHCQDTAAKKTPTCSHRSGFPE